MLENKIGKLRKLGRPWVLEDGTIDLRAVDYSAISMWLRCGRQYKFRYVEGLKNKPGISLPEGTAQHAAMEADNRSKKDADKILPATQLTEIFVDKFRHEVVQCEKDCEELKLKFDWEDENEDTIIKRASAIHVQYATDWSPTIKPVTVEEPFTKKVEIDGVSYRLFGQTDLTQADELDDYKTAARAKSQKDVDNDLQLSIYSWVKNLPKVSFISFIKTKKPYIQKLNSVRSPGQWLWALKVVTSAVQAIRAGQFPLANPGAFPSPWFCSEKFCGYWGKCRGQYDPTKEVADDE